MLSLSLMLLLILKTADEIMLSHLVIDFYLFTKPSPLAFATRGQTWTLFSELHSMFSVLQSGGVIHLFICFSRCCMFIRVSPTITKQRSLSQMNSTSMWRTSKPTHMTFLRSNGYFFYSVFLTVTALFESHVTLKLNDMAGNVSPIKNVNRPIVFLSHLKAE